MIKSFYKKDQTDSANIYYHQALSLAKKNNDKLLVGKVLGNIGIILFAQAGSLELAIISMLSFALFLKMANGATYAITPFVNEKNIGMVSGIVGAGGNVGGMCFGFLFKSATISYIQAFEYIGYVVIGVSLIVSVTRFGAKKVVAVSNIILENEVAVA